MDELTAVRVPTITQESARDLVRAREDARIELMAARHRLSKLLLRHGIVYSGGQAWVGAHDAWLRRQRFDSPLLQAAFDEAYDSVITITARRDRLDERIEDMAVNSQYTDVVRRLGCLRGISTLTGFGLAVELEITLPNLDHDAAQELADKAHQVCPYSNATRGNIDVKITVTDD